MNHSSHDLKPTSEVRVTWAEPHFVCYSIWFVFLLTITIWKVVSPSIVKALKDGEYSLRTFNDNMRQLLHFHSFSQGSLLALQVVFALVGNLDLGIYFYLGNWR